MQQWLNLVPMAGALLNLSAAMTNLATTIINRRGTHQRPGRQRHCTRTSCQSRFG